MTESTRHHNIQVLTNNGFRQFSNTTVFFKEAICVISPSVAQNSTGGYWFDLRKVNLDRLSTNAYLLVRVVPDQFILIALSDIKSLIAEELMDNRTHSGDVWGVKMDFNNSNCNVQLYSNKDSTSRVYCNALTVDSVTKALRSL
ncbi:hypothetical protein [Vibrio breoganii]|uniref:hypothetical protein n=1 Tax=Vibrio breoganii TaxID=553239 RepID=UPI000C81C1A9|nr:hypothetical protein [Vibrio breoganii]PML92992.1 hypothetical protein BCT64_14885 [Vibrio breoganii]PMN61622.1 hypothetical protein BCT28_11550 [Vibrio breoganii]PMP04371.1 hypothetical protein BCS94_16360 [Vibrio breoganii]